MNADFDLGRSLEWQDVAREFVTCLSRRLVEPLLQRTLKHCAQADHCSHVTLV